MSVLSENSDAGKWLIYIAGSAKAQSEALAVFIEKETGLPCRIADADGMFPQTFAPGRSTIIFSDCRNLSTEEILTGMNEFKQRQKKDAFVILFNVAGTLNIEEELLNLGIWGVFYENDAPGSLPLGVDAIRKGEIWLSRQAMSSCLVNLRRRKRVKVQSPEENLLTSREREVLEMLSDGFGNEQIAAKMKISIHTVRSHLYRVFRKIGVSNRNQAAIWMNSNFK